MKKLDVVLHKSILHKAIFTISLSFSIIFLSIILTSCGSLEGIVNDAQKVAEAGTGAQWINSSIEGVIDEDYPVDCKTDFYTAVNKTWILDQKLDGTEQCVDLFKIDDKVTENKLKLIDDPDSTGYENNTGVGLSREELEHAGKIVEHFVKATEDMQSGKSKGAEALRPYIEAIDNIKTLDEFSSYLLDFDGMNIAGAPLINISVDNTMTDIENYQVILRPIPHYELSLKNSYAYDRIDADAIVSKQENSAIIRTVLYKLGYDDRYIDTVLKRAYRLEIRIAGKMKSDVQIMLPDYEKEYAGRYTLEELETYTGDYPVGEILKAYGYTTDKYTMFEPDYMTCLGKTYNQSNLEELKAYHIMRTVLTACDLLDTETAEEVRLILNRGEEEKEAPEDTDTPQMKARKQIISDYVDQYIRAPFDMMYIAAYCSAEEKEKIMEMTLDMKEQLRRIIAEEEWLSEESKKNAIEKLDAMKLKVLYPDKYYSYLGLDISDDTDLIEIVRDINIYEKRKCAEYIGEKYDRTMWDLNLIPTSMVNAYNDITSNSMIVLAGYIAGKITFDPEREYEINLAKLGTTIGHELTHGFDSTGYGYDKNGRSTSFDEDGGVLTTEDELTLVSKSFKLSAAFTAISPMPGKDTYGASISGEAIADMGGMKCALYEAAEREHFDYDRFFRSYAELWRKKVTRKTEELYAQADEHPLAFLRVNVTVQQYDEFMETYAVKPGDGMYLAPENRISVW